ncbi:MAG: rRNA methyltransferase [Bacteroidales bacterium]|nr:rRNA methyltransferase [Bacteroidales bacterium]
MYPEFFRNRINLQEYVDAEALLRALEEPSPVSIRTNTAKWNRKPSGSESVAWCKSGYYLDYRPSFTSDPLFHAGCYYPQEASSMFIEEVFRQFAESRDYIRVLDLCGAPGGKSTHLSELIGSKGLLVANEVIISRAAVLSENITKWGRGNTIVTCSDPSCFGKLEGYFDLIVVDAPCSGEGMFRDPQAVKQWSPENALHCSERQKRILKDVLPALKEDGILIYSTCTFNPDENEKNVKWLADRFQMECREVDISEFKNITKIDYQGITGYGFHPGKITGEGLFFSVLIKTGRQEQKAMKAVKNPFKRLTKDELSGAADWSHFPEENLVRSNNGIVSVAGNTSDFIILSRNLRIIKGGTKICSVKNNVHIPSHELAISTGLKSSSFGYTALDYDQAIAYLRRDNFTITGAPAGWQIVTYKGVNLGFINNIGKRINNYYPVDWRIRMKISATAQEEIIWWK